MRDKKISHKIVRRFICQCAVLYIHILFQISSVSFYSIVVEKQPFFLHKAIILLCCYSFVLFCKVGPSNLNMSLK